ncbi:sulfotransferase family protein [Microbulbifer agarilyticus]|uniref:sulfotransferase family protein n=1 Tax=Microbulbifer agarilyticus TaxID=260552 RepID=UPI001CD50265|nr:sulfotransferase [Microbulbifer agarilyticus]MCA0900230.1 sulfotransferase domain-containing protein [Microbulbifer agarilyticus]
MIQEKQTLPDFVIIGSMKSATTTIYEQLRKLDGIYMPELKEPNFFSDDAQYARGADWYKGLFESAERDDILGEASTHYTKLPTYPKTVERLYESLPNAKLIYVMRHPIERLISQYIHEWSCNNIKVDINQAIEQHSELLNYSCYARQLGPFIERYGRDKILPVFFERLRAYPQSELERIAQFIGYTGKVTWQDDLSKTNVSSERLRTNPVTRFLIGNPVLKFLRRVLVPRALRNAVKSRLQMKKRPILSEASLRKIQHILNRDLEELGYLLGTEITVDNYRDCVVEDTLDWSTKQNDTAVGGEHAYS